MIVLLVPALLAGLVAGKLLPARSGWSAPPPQVLVVAVTGTVVTFTAPISGWAAVPAGAAVTAAAVTWWAVRSGQRAAAGLWLPGAGGNIAVIAANGGMPVPGVAGDVTAGHLWRHVPGDGMALGWLSDHLAVAGVHVSPGDVVMLAAIVAFTATAVRSGGTGPQHEAGVDHRGP